MINPNKRMMVAPPMVQVVQTMLAQALLVPPSLSASSREPIARVASTATVMGILESSSCILERIMTR
jgi:hypothetical protein